MLTKRDNGIIEGFIEKAYQNVALELDTIQFIDEGDIVTFRSMFRFQVTHKNDESEGIQWRFQVVNFTFKIKGLYIMLNDNYFNDLFNVIVKQLMNAKPMELMKSRLYKNEQLVERK